jgi:hypothetical protein
MGEEKIRSLLQERLQKRKQFRQDVENFRNPDPKSGDIGIEKSGEKAPSYLPPMSGPPDRDPTKNPFRNTPAPDMKQMKKSSKPIQDT